MIWPDENGQILIPGIAAYLGLLVVFFALVASGVKVLAQMRMDMAAQAAALSAARAEADELNHCASHNLTANLFVNLRYRGTGAMQKSLVDAFNAWLWVEKVNDPVHLFGGFVGFPAAVGSRVAKLNGSTLPGIAHTPINLQLHLNNLSVYFFKGYIPLPLPPEEFRGVYYSRIWGPDEKHPQPPHQISWVTKRGNFMSSATAGIYLDERDDAIGNNGGFPRDPKQESILGNLEFQSFYPQFNARLVKTAQTSELVNLLGRFGG